MADMPSDADLVVDRCWLPRGEAGTDQTIVRMDDISMGVWGARSAKIQALAYSIIGDAGVVEKDQPGEVAAVHAWVMSHLHYVKDPVGQEKLTYPETLAFSLPYGDCDDHVVLERALLGAIGIRTRMKVVGFVAPQMYQHVYHQAQVKGDWINLDPIVKDKPVGWEIPAEERIAEKTYAVDPAPEGGGLVAAFGVSAAMIALLAWLASRPAPRRRR